MIIIFGQKAYGKVDRVPGVCYIVTIFAHLNFIPLIPVRSYIVVEGTENGSEFRGKEVPVSLKSALAGYVRVWSGAAAVIGGLVAGFGLSGAAAALRVNALATAGLLVAGGGGLLALFVGGRFGAVVQIGAHAVSALVWYAFNDAMGQNGRAGRAAEGPLFALLVANLALLLFGLTRFMDRASPARTRDLFRQLGMELPPEDGEEPDAQQSKWEGWDESEDRRHRG